MAHTSEEPDQKPEPPEPRFMRPDWGVGHERAEHGQVHHKSQPHDNTPKPPLRPR